MKVNQNIKIVGNNVILVPYRESHVAKYHQWMLSEELQKLTASEPLSLEEEYQMQKSWIEDEDKCTFIVLDKETYLLTGSEEESMVGDTNLFVEAEHEEEKAAEIDIMIAESGMRRKQRGKEATLLMLKYGLEKLGIGRFIAKIGSDNTASIKLFQQLGFEEISHSQVFCETTFSTGGNKFVQYLRDHVTHYAITN